MALTMTKPAVFLDKDGTLVENLPYNVDPRYPGTGTSKREAAAALRWASKVRDACRSLLGLRPPRRRRKEP